uniref:TAFII28-like protein domain-containing protein n=1 Tax=Eutreptiella gymnastica TaxID=73025 RepID=A0A7S4GK75_9EUGL
MDVLRTVPRRQLKPAIPTNLSSATVTRPRKRVHEAVVDEEAPNNKRVTRASDRLGKKLLLNNTAAVDVSLQDDVYAQHPQPTRSVSKELITKISKRMNQEQEGRVTRFRQAHLNRTSVKKVMQDALPVGTTISPTMLLVTAGAAKVFAAQLIETARTVQQQWKDASFSDRDDADGGHQLLRPQHVIEAYRRLQQSNSLPANPQPRQASFLL